MKNGASGSREVKAGEAALEARSRNVDLAPSGRRWLGLAAPQTARQLELQLADSSPA